MGVSADDSLAGCTSGSRYQPVGGQRLLDLLQQYWEQGSELSRGCNGCCLLASLETELKQERKSSYHFWSGEERSTGG